MSLRAHLLHGAMYSSLALVNVVAVAPGARRTSGWSASTRTSSRRSRGPCTQVRCGPTSPAPATSASTGPALNGLVAPWLGSEGQGAYGAYLASDLVVGGSGDADAIRLCNALKPRSDIDAVSEDIMWLNDNVADIDADAEGNAAILRVGGRSVSDTALELYGSPNGFHGARKLR